MKMEKVLFCSAMFLTYIVWRTTNKFYLNFCIYLFYLFLYIFICFIFYFYIDTLPFIVLHTADR